MSISYQVTLEDCVLSEETVWENIKNVDKLFEPNYLLLQYLKINCAFKYIS